MGNAQKPSAKIALFRKRHEQPRHWSPDATVVLPSRGKVKLTDQPPELQKVIRGGIQAVLRMAIEENAFPPLDSRISHARKALLVGARENNAQEIKERLKVDDDFVRQLEDLVSFNLHYVPILINL